MADGNSESKPEPVVTPPIQNARRRRVYGKLEVPEHYRKIPEPVTEANPDIKKDDLEVTLLVVVKDRQGVLYEEKRVFPVRDAKIQAEAPTALRACKHEVTGWWKRLEMKLIKEMIKQDPKKPVITIEDHPTGPNEAMVPAYTEAELAAFEVDAPSLNNIPDDLKTVGENSKEAAK